MKTALIVMTILGCDDSVSQCHYVATVEKSFTSITECDSRSEAEITAHQNRNYPVIVAVCETPTSDSASVARDAEAEEAAQGAQAAALPETPVAQPLPATGLLPADTLAQDAGPGVAAKQPATLPRRALDLITGVLPSRDQVKAVVTTPVHTLENGYSWVARRFTQD